MINLHWRSGRDLTTHSVERPGLALTGPEIEALTAALRTVATTTLHQSPLDYGVLGGDADRLCRAA